MSDAAYQPSVFARDHTLLGVCEALGEDFGFNPVYLRVLLAVVLYLNPVGVIAAYLGAGLVVLLSRLLAPNPRRALPVHAEAEAPQAQRAERNAAETEQLELAIAA